jgi:D-alanyl-D-alanine carboxypeptidase
MMRGTKSSIRQVRAILAGGRLHEGTHPWLRVPVGAALLSLVFLLTPELTLAPTSAVEPQAAAPAPVERTAVRTIPPRVRLIDLREPLAPEAPAPAPFVLAPPVEDVRFDAAIEAARAEGGAYGVTFAAVRDGEMVWYGSAGRHRDATTPLAPTDPLVIGSVTKTFVAATILQLAEEGRLSLDDELGEHLPAMSSINREITIRQLLDHTSGLADVFNDTTRRGLEEHPEHAWTTKEVFKTLHAPWYEPGEGWAYANTNYFLLGLIVESVSGATLADELERRFLGPLALQDTRMLTGAADDEGPLAPAWSTIFWASGAMSASAADLARWGDALYGEELLDDASRAAMIELNSHDYGLGLQRIQVPGAIGYGHTGLLNTYTTLLAYLPEQDVTVALLVNRSDVDLGGMLAAEPLNGKSLLELVGVEPPPLPSPSSSPAVLP